MKKLTALFLAVFLSACGGGGSSTPAKATPPTNANAIVLSNANIDVSGLGGNFLIQAASGVNVTVSGQGNLVEFSPNQAASAVAITGDGNTMIIRPGSSAAYLSVTGIGSTFWIPDSMNLAVDNPSPPAITINKYTP